ncbi:MAG: 3'-5' exonuclease [Cytophagaceae bacterium]
MESLKKLGDILFLDIETVSCTPTYQELDERLRSIWDKKASFIDKLADKSDLFFQKAGIYAEFGKIVSISAGFFFLNNRKELSLKVKSFYGHEEGKILCDFKELLENGFKGKKVRLCAHNGKEFDFPYLCRRLLINGIPLPEALKLSGKKPWEVQHLDTLEMWKFGDKKNYTSLDLLAAVFDIPSSKSDLDGSMVNATYYSENNLEKIKTYCEKDVVVTARVFLKYNCLPELEEENIIIL